MISARNAASVRELVDLDGQGCEPDLPSLQGLVAPEPRGAPQTGTKVLMQAVLEEGVRNYLARSGRLHSEAECWIASSQQTSPFAFAVVCETLGLEPSAVRVALRRLREKKLSGRQVLRRTRPNVRRPARLLAGKAG